MKTYILQNIELIIFLSITLIFILSYFFMGLISRIKFLTWLQLVSFVMLLVTIVGMSASKNRIWHHLHHYAGEAFILFIFLHLFYHRNFFMGKFHKPTQLPHMVIPAQKNIEQQSPKDSDK